MTPRAYWTGHIRLSLVSFPVRLYPAVAESDQVQFHLIHRPSGERVRYQSVVPEHGPVPKDEIVKGYEYEKGRYVTFEPGELTDLKVETSHTIELVQFVDAVDLDPVYFERPYYLAPEGEAATEAFAVLREALRRSRKVGLGQIAFAGKERIAAIRPCGRGMLLETLRFAEEIRDAHPYFEEIGSPRIDEEEIALATRLIAGKTAPFDPSRFQDRYQEALRDLIEAKLARRPPPQPAAEPPPGGAGAVSLIDALRSSIAESGAPPPVRRSTAARPKGTAPKAVPAGRARGTGTGRRRSA